jgi:hypothetical protein
MDSPKRREWAARLDEIGPGIPPETTGSAWALLNLNGKNQTAAQHASTICAV